MEKENGTKIELSLNVETADILTKIEEETGKTKSRIIEEAIMFFSEREEIIKERIKKIELFGESALLNLDKIIEERRKK